ncbi:MAG: hypothetical protein J6Q10_01370, partial [Clostridia bacterium]|nr:hypothetical protein [Clostridia bacterium]
DSSASSELKSLESEIKKLSAGSQTSDFYSRDTAKIEQTISQELKNISLLGYQNRMEDIAEICEKVAGLIESRRVITGETEAKDSALELENLKKRKAELEAKYNIERTAVHAPKAGVFTARVDGLEEILTNQALKELSPASIKELDKKSVQAKVSSKVESGKPIGKIVNNFNWNIGVLVPFEFAEDMDEGDIVDIRFTDIDVKTIKGTITRISPEEGGKVVLVINTNKYVDMIYSSSRVNVEIIKHHYEGFKLPSKSIRILDGKTGVYVIRNDKAHFISVDILYNSKEWVIAAESVAGGSTIKLYDELIVDGKNLYDNKVVR